MQDKNMRNMKKKVLSKTKHNLFILNLNKVYFKVYHIKVKWLLKQM